MRLKVLSAASRVTSTSSAPEALIVPAYTGSPGPLSTGTLSPVIGLWSTALKPARTRPSTLTRSPGRIKTRSPTSSSSTRTSTVRGPSTVSPPSSSLRAMGGARLNSPSSARRARSVA